MIAVIIALFFVCYAIGLGIAYVMAENARRQGRRPNSSGVGCLGLLFGMAIFFVGAVVVMVIVALANFFGS